MILVGRRFHSRHQQIALAVPSHREKNAKKRAVVAVARKLAVLLHRVWV